MTEPAAPPPAGNSPDALVRREQERIRGAVVAQLLEVPELRAKEARTLLEELVCESTRSRASLREHSTAQLQLLELFRFCVDQPGGLSALARGVGEIRAGCPQAVRIQHFADEWTALGVLPEMVESWRLLEDGLGTLPLSAAYRMSLVREATGNRVLEPRPHCETPWDDFLYLVGQNVAQNVLPPWVYYLVRSAEQMPLRAKHEILTRSRRWAQRCGLAVLMDQLVFASDPPVVQRALRREYLTISIAPHPVNRTLYTVSHAFMPDAGVHEWERGRPERSVVQDQLERVVGDLIRRVERRAGDRHADLWLEFVLPFELLNLPVDWWARDVLEDRRTPLIVPYPVFIRSLERLRSPEWYRPWRKRWEQFRLGESATASVFVNTCRQDGGHLSGLAARLAGNEHYVALVLSRPPTHDGRDGEHEIGAALRSGLPIIIWHRDAERTREFHEAVRALLADGLAQFPVQVASYRRQAAEQEAAQQPTHLGRHIAVLWDDPDRNPLAHDPR
jgi:NTP-dependent ternary conflict system VMAP-like protein/effector-associated domain 2 (EAD2)-containing protein